ncbi:MAG: hypothetical protein ABR954_06425 [Dehalococcoidales bacterium]
MEISFKSKAHVPTLVISGMLLFAAVFLPWASIGGMAAGTGTSDWGAMSTIASILGLGLAFLTNAKARALGLMVIGVLALVGAIIYAVRLEGATISFGIIFEMLFALAAIFFGFQNYTKRGSK